MKPDYYLKSCTKYLKQGKEIRQNWTAPETFDIWVCVIFDHYFKTFISGREAESLLPLSNYGIFLIFSNFLVGNSLVNSHTVFFILDTKKYRLTLCQVEPVLKRWKCQSIMWKIVVSYSFI